MTSSDNTPETRSIEVERVVDATVEEAWEAVSTTEGLKNWFPLDALVEPGVDGKVWLSWGPGMAAEAPIYVWDAPHRLGWKESYGEDGRGNPIAIAVDFYVEAGAEGTVVRVVQSGFSADSQWDEMYDAITDGWTYFMFNLVLYLAKHLGKKRRMAWRRQATGLSREDIWKRLADAGLIGEPGSGDSDTLKIDVTHRFELVSAREGRHFAAVLPELSDSALFVEIEGKHVGFWLSTYGMADPAVDALQAGLDARVEEVLGTA